MPSVSNAVGTFFEERLLRSLPNLEDMRDVADAPDFRWGPLWLEAKAAYDAPDYGGLPKVYQFEMHVRHAPMLYAFGYHDFEHASKRLHQTTQQGRVRHLHRNASIARMYFVSSEFVEHVWEKDHRVSRKDALVYCRFPANLLTKIVENDEVRRAGVVRAAREYFNIPTCTSKRAEPIGYVLTSSDYSLLEPRLKQIAIAELMNPTG